jgi:hypothetical protein
MNAKQHTRALDRMSKPAYRFIPDVGFRPRRCPFCKKSGLRVVYKDETNWCYTCGWRTGMPKK